ncbi:uncharacterized protein B0I36DRAFT_317983 [Microdochium trichocladiopsis]|uniref:Diphthamide biosynthesis protein 4 n=1 Tax=Microdochium trichocladiopsis TaxID=1682393 RepID=A0A9P8YC01_9PEZI|nr:uncharacterized protein B0I36DRAFT_317983 [Microdochium trichocladiopsis]KAH7035259.1 hypothetical protein B0I36DRAFT_317983 [Microdochium trichocladiopsis]
MAPPNAKQPTLYEILSLTPKHLEGQTSTAQSKVVKKAYHRALLQHHPDKTSTRQPNGEDGETTASSSSSSSKTTKKGSSPPKVTYTVDQIQEAYTTLSDTKKRAEYNRSLLVSNSSSSTTSRQQQFTHSATFSATRSFQTGLEVVDLDDVDFDERKGLYFRACRCGNPRGYRFKEHNLEENEDEGVLMVECLDCSLWLKVLFTAAVVDDEDGVSNNSSNNKQGNQARAASVSSHQQQQQQQAARRDSSQSVSRGGSTGEKKGGWTFKVSLGLSLGGSASASASSGRR